MSGVGTYTRARVSWSLDTLEKWVSSMVRVPVSATWPQPQNRATPEKQRMVATSEAYGTPPRHLMQHSKHPAGGERENSITSGSVRFQVSSIKNVLADLIYLNCPTTY